MVPMRKWWNFWRVATAGASRSMLTSRCCRRGKDKCGVVAPMGLGPRAKGPGGGGCCRGNIWVMECKSYTHFLGVCEPCVCMLEIKLVLGSPRDRSLSQ